MKSTVVVIGAGPSGIMASIAASKKNRQVILIDKNNEIGKKLRITGGGRCNITNNCSITEIIDKTMNNNKFLYNCLNTFSNKNLMDLIESKGCKLKVEPKGKVFPISDKSSDIIDVFLKLLEESKVTLKMNSEVDKIIANNNKVNGVKMKDGSIITCDGVILATGGMSYPHLGSTGDGYKFAKDLGHNINNIKPSLVPIVIKEKWVTDLMGISLQNIKLSTKIKNKNIVSEGDLIFTHYGISGPAVLEHSAYINKYSKSLEHIVHLDLLPEQKREDLEELFQNESKLSGSKLVKSILLNFFPKNFCAKFLEILQIKEDLKLGELSKKDRNKIIESIKNLTVTMVAFRPIKEAIITSGGITVKEIDSRTMESKLVEGLYFAGEIIDIDAITGGYNLQLAFSTGYLAGINI